jgi:DNA-binding XRE family transcriptional regulator
VQIWYRVPDEDVFRLFMAKAGHSGSSLADAVGCTRQAISLLAKGQRTCRPNLADKISEVLAQPRDAIFMRCVSRTALKTSTNTPRKAA